MLTAAIELGLVLGVRHASDADHVCTIAALLRSERGLRDAVTTALLWSVGHSISFFFIGLLVVGLDLHLPVGFSAATDVLIGGLLVGLGVSQWRHADCEPSQTPVRQRGARTLSLGLAHGLAGSAGVSLIALATMPDRGSALSFLLVFGVGTVLGMIAVTFLLSVPLGSISRRSDRWRTRVLRTAAGFSIVAGLWLLAQFASSLPGLIS